MSHSVNQQTEMFANLMGYFARASDDICRNRHCGNPESIAANANNAEHRSQQQQKVLDFIRHRGADGATTDEIAVAFSTTPNSLSGRMTELKRDRRIEKRGTRETRSGSRAGVYVALVLMLCAARLSAQTVETIPKQDDRPLTINLGEALQVSGIRVTEAEANAADKSPRIWRPLRNEEVIVTLVTLDGRKWVARWEEMK